MARGSIQLRHRKACPANGKEARTCRCGPTVYAVVDGTWVKAGYLPEGWRRDDLAPFERRLIDTREALEAGQNPKPRRIVKLGDYATGWFDELHAAAKAGHISKLTYNAYETTWFKHLAPAFGGVPIAAIDAAMIRRYGTMKAEEGLAAQTVRNHVSACLSAMLSDAVAEGLIAANPARQPRGRRHGNARRRHASCSNLSGRPRSFSSWSRPARC
jgi:hypothetical protein